MSHGNGPPEPVLRDRDRAGGHADGAVLSSCRRVCCMLHTTCFGERRLRVHTTAYPTTSNLSEVFASQIAVVTLFANKAVESSMAPEADTAGEKGVIIPPVLPLTSERLERHMLFLIEDGQKIFLAMPPPVPSRPTHPTPAASRAVLPLPARLPRHCHVAPSQQLRPHRPPLRPSRVRAATPVPASPLPSTPRAARAPPVPSRPTPRRPPPVPLLLVRVPSRRHSVAAPFFPVSPTRITPLAPLPASTAGVDVHWTRGTSSLSGRGSPPIPIPHSAPHPHGADGSVDAQGLTTVGCAQRAYETMYTLVRVGFRFHSHRLIGIHLDTCLAKLELPTFLGRVLPGLVGDSDEITKTSRT
ncbi:hypothetical protein B0H14DRAFT_3532858 [Mycena olivaceomarginata]|nr:hypothetical protein B0H14DRAFT_3532858 [Mycena olivaceomarginata]